MINYTLIKTRAIFWVNYKHKISKTEIIIKRQI